jgi:hypothetical protein
VRKRLEVELGYRAGRGVVTETGLRVDGRAAARLQCDCGNVYVTTVRSIVPLPRTGGINTRSCGCLRRDVVRAAYLARHREGLPPGVRAERGRFTAGVSLGSYDSAEEAGEAYQRAVAALKREGTWSTITRT